MDEGGAGGAETAGALDSYYEDGGYGDEKLRQVRSSQHHFLVQAWL